MTLGSSSGADSARRITLVETSASDAPPSGKNATCAPCSLAKRSTAAASSAIVALVVRPAAHRHDDQRPGAVEPFGAQVERRVVGLQEEDGVGGAFDAHVRQQRGEQAARALVAHGGGGEPPQHARTTARPHRSSGPIDCAKIIVVLRARVAVRMMPA